MGPPTLFRTTVINLGFTFVGNFSIVAAVVVVVVVVIVVVPTFVVLVFVCEGICFFSVVLVLAVPSGAWL